jgi:hypothetical protein
VPAPAEDTWLFTARPTWDAGRHMHAFGTRPTLDECEAEGRKGVASGEYTEFDCEHVAETSDDDQRPVWVYVQISHRHGVTPVRVFSAMKWCEQDIKERIAAAHSGSAGSYAAGLECVEYSLAPQE